MDDLRRASALDQAAAIRAGTVSSGELLQEYLRRIEAADPELHAFVVRLDARALRRADRMTAKARKQPTMGPLLGVPYAIKDTEALRGARFRAGSRAYQHLWSPVDSGVTRRSRGLGVNIVGKTATSELALMPVIETDLQPATVNPWNTDYTAGGSSGGSASAVAGGLLPLAGASDGAGSIRIPASLCHLFGFKPSRDLTPRFYRAFDPVGLAVAGAVTHYVEDSACVMDALTGNYAVVPQPGSLRAACHRAPPRGLKVGVCTQSPLVETSADIAAAVQRVGALLSEMGHNVEPHDGVHDGTIEEFVPIYGRLLANPPIFSEAALQPVTRWMRAQGRDVNNKGAIARAAVLSAMVDEWFGDSDLMITPTVAIDPPLAYAWRDLEAADQFHAAASLGAFTAPFNLSGQPAASIPMGLSAAGLPMGVQVVARRDADALLFSVCAELERALRWADLRAPMAGG